MKAGNIIDPFSPAYDSGGITPFWFDMSAVRISPEVADGESYQAFIEDREYTVINNASVYPNFFANIRRQRKEKIDELISRSSSNESVCVPDPNNENRWIYVGDGSCTCTVSSNSRSVNFNVNLAEYSEDEFSEFVGYKTDSLAYHIINTVYSRVEMNGDKKIYSTMDHANSNYVRNENCWVFDLPGAVAPFSVWNSSSGQRKAGTLVTPQDIAFTVHYQLRVGNVVRFIGVDGTVYDRTITATRLHPDYSPYYPDLALGHLDSPLPENVPFAKILPANWKDYLPAQASIRKYNYPGNYPFPLPMFAGDQEKKATLIEFVGDPWGWGHQVQRPVDNEIASYYEHKILGDSSSPGGFIINGELVLIEMWTYGGVGIGTKLYLFKDDLNAMLLDMGSEYTLTDADFSAFPTY